MPRSPSRISAVASLSLATLLLFQAAGPARAEIILVDHFTGDSNGVPAGWTDIGFDSNVGSTIVESGTVATITDTRGNGGPQLMQSSAVVATTDSVSLQVDIASMSGSGPVSIAVIGGLTGKGLMTQFNATTKNFTLAVTQNGGALGVLHCPQVPACLPTAMAPSPTRCRPTRTACD